MMYDFRGEWKKVVKQAEKNTKNCIGWEVGKSKKSRKTKEKQWKTWKQI